MSSAQETRADGWQHDVAQLRITVAILARENRAQRERIAELEAALTAATAPTAGDAHQPHPAP